MLNSHDLADRQLIAAVREHDDLCQRRYKITKLDQPVQRGWRRRYVLSEDAVRRRDRSILEAILAVIGTVQVHHSREFRARRGRRRKLVEIEQPLRPIPVHEWQRKSYPREWHCYFRYELLLEWNRHWQPYWMFKQPSLYELKIERNWLWYFREIDPAIETRLSELERWLESRRGWQRYGWLKGQSQHWHWPEEDLRERALRREHERVVVRAKVNFPEVDPAVPHGAQPDQLPANHLKFPRRSPTAEALRSERSQCGCESCRRDHFAAPAAMH